MNPALQQLLTRARGPAGKPREVALDATSGPLRELSQLLTTVNGFFAFNAGVHVFRAGEPGFGPELQTWNHPDTWKNHYADLANGLFCFGQDLFGTQFAIKHRAEIVTFDAETAHCEVIGSSLQHWAQWLLDNPNGHGCDGYATHWQDAHGPLDASERLLPWQFFTVGGTFEHANITAKDAATCMRIRGPLAQRLQSLPEGTTLKLPNPKRL